MKCINFTWNKNTAGRMLLLLVICLGLMVSFSSCKKKKNYLKDVNSNTFTVNEDGSILEISCQDFSGVSYDISGIKDEINSQIEAYRSARGEDKKNATVKLLQYEEKNGIVKLAMKYADLASYNSFNNTNYRIEALNILPADAGLKDLSGNDILMSEISDNNYKVFLADGEFQLTLNGSILYYNEHVTVSGSDIFLDGNGTAAVIFQ